jgi:TonB family protein
MALDLNHDFETDRTAASHGLMLRVVGFAVFVIVAFYFGIKAFSSHERVAETAQRAALVDDLPPPLPPPEIEPEPEMEEVAEEIIEEPLPGEEPPPAGEVLGLDAQGEAGGDQFGLASRKGGRDLITATAGGGEGGDVEAAWNAYAGSLALTLERLLNARDELRKALYDVTVRMWVGSDGGVTRAELVRSTGNRERDRMIEKALVEAVVRAPPKDMPQPLRLRIRVKQLG